MRVQVFDTPGTLAAGRSRRHVATETKVDTRLQGKGGLQAGNIRRQLVAKRSWRSACRVRM